MAIGSIQYEPGTRGAALLFPPDTRGEVLEQDAPLQLVGSLTRDTLGYRIAFPGDVDGDGLGELLVAAHEAHRPLTSAGAAFLFHPPSSGEGVPEDASVWFRSASGNARHGAPVPVGDIDGDGLADLVIGTGQELLGTFGGGYHLYLGRTTGRR